MQSNTPLVNGLEEDMLGNFSARCCTRWGAQSRTASKLYNNGKAGAGGTGRCKPLTTVPNRKNVPRGN
jgi:hypothetical protein